jgi:hypothetical protein
MRNLVAALVLVAGCSKKQDAPEAPPKTSDVEAFATVTLDHAQRVADAAKTGDCAKLKDAYDTYVRNPVALDPTVRPAFDDKYGAKLDALLAPAKAALANCSGPFDAATYGPRFVAMCGKIAAAVTSASGDCKLIAANLEPLKADALAISQLAPTSEADKKAFNAQFGKQVTDALAPATDGITKCKDDASVKAFFAMF